jgi:hypothetical protein
MVCTMNPYAIALLRTAAVAFALVRGLGEFAMLQRWRLRAWVAR